MFKIIEKIMEKIGYILLKDYKPQEKERYEFQNYYLIVKPKIMEAT